MKTVSVYIDQAVWERTSFEIEVPDDLEVGSTEFNEFLLEAMRTIPDDAHNEIIDSVDSSSVYGYLGPYGRVDLTGP